MKLIYKHISLCTPLIISLLLWHPTGAGAADNPFKLSPEPGSASYSDGSFSPLLNPALADAPGYPVLAYKYLFYDGEKTGSHFARAGFMGFSFIYGKYQNIYIPQAGRILRADAHYFNFSKGFMIKKVFGFGTGYSFSKSENRFLKGYGAWNLGILLRPIRYISVGFAMDDLLARVNSNRIEWTETYSLSIRPYREYLTLSADIIRKRGEKPSDLNYRFSLDARLFYDISLFFSYDTATHLMFGITLPLVFGSYPASGIVLNYQRSYRGKSIPDYNSIGVSIPFARNKSALNLSYRKTMLKIVISGGINEIEKRNIFTGKGLVFYDVVNAVNRAAHDPEIDGIICIINSADLGYAQIQELRQELKNVRAQGKKVYAVMSEPGNKEYYLATAAERIYYTPSTPFYLTGLSAQVYFLKGLLDKIGVKYESIKKGTYKSFNERFTRDKMSDPFRENMTALVTDLNTQYIGDIISDRGLDRSVIDDIFSRGAVTPDEAAQMKLVDAVEYPDNALDELSEKTNVVGLGQYIHETVKDPAWGPVPAVAIIYVDGSIVRGKSFNRFIFKTLGDETYKAILNRVFKDPVIRAVVIRVNSGGGSAAASDYMWNYLVKMKKKYNKPVVFSFGNVAASGGYYIACTGDKIFSSRGTVTGSIGVIFGKLSLKGLYEKLGINKDVIKMSEFADLFSESRDLTDKEKKILQFGVNFMYDRFTGKVVKARSIDKEKIDEIAEGRVFSGTAAAQNGLIDEMGGIVTAVNYAKLLGNITGQYEVKKYPDERTFFPNLFSMPEFKAIAETMETMIRSTQYLQFKDEEVLYLYPYDIEIK